jgi:hypothetical protein
VKDIALVLRNKRVQLARLALEIHGLEAAATPLRSGAHLLAGNNPPLGNAMGHITLTEESAASTAEDVRRWV